MVAWFVPDGDVYMRSIPGWILYLGLRKLRWFSHSCILFIYVIHLSLLLYFTFIVVAPVVVVTGLLYLGLSGFSSNKLRCLSYKWYPLSLLYFFTFLVVLCSGCMIYTPRCHLRGHFIEVKWVLFSRKVQCWSHNRVLFIYSIHFFFRFIVVGLVAAWFIPGGH